MEKIHIKIIEVIIALIGVIILNIFLLPLVM